MFKATLILLTVVIVVSAAQSRPRAPALELKESRGTGCIYETFKGNPKHKYGGLRMLCDDATPVVYPFQSN